MLVVKVRVRVVRVAMTEGERDERKRQVPTVRLMITESAKSEHRFPRAQVTNAGGKADNNRAESDTESGDVGD